jgi:hypothetical protein
MMTTDELKKLVEAATPGPWKIVSEPGSKRLETGDGAIMGDEPYYPWAPDNDADWQLIAAAPALAREVIALREAAGEAAGYIESVIEDGCKKCGGDCSSAMPPVIYCPIREATQDLAALRAVLGESE